MTEKKQPEDDAIDAAFRDKDGNLHELKLHLPQLPDNRNLSMYKVLAHQFQYWDARRVMRQYQLMVEAGVDMANSVKRFMEASEKVREAQARWELQPDYRKIVATQVRAELDAVEERRSKSRAAALDARRREQVAELMSERIDELLAIEVMQIVNQTKAAKLEAIDLDLQIAQKQSALEKVREGGEKKEAETFGDRLRRVEQINQDYQRFREMKDAIIAEHGGEANLPDAVLAALKNLEDSLGFPEEEE